MSGTDTALFPHPQKYYDNLKRQLLTDNTIMLWNERCAGVGAMQEGCWKLLLLLNLHGCDWVMFAVGSKKCPILYYLLFIISHPHSHPHPSGLTRYFTICSALSSANIPAGPRLHQLPHCRTRHTSPSTLCLPSP